MGLSCPVPSISPYCQPHFERFGVLRPAEHVVAGEGFCSACFNGIDLVPEPPPGSYGAPSNAAPVAPCETADDDWEDPEVTWDKIEKKHRAVREIGQRVLIEIREILAARTDSWIAARDLAAELATTKDLPGHFAKGRLRAWLAAIGIIPRFHRFGRSTRLIAYRRESFFVESEVQQRNARLIELDSLRNAALFRSATLRSAERTARTATARRSRFREAPLSIFALEPINEENTARVKENSL